MKIIIDDKRKISEIQQEFSKLFPYLKIQFFAKPNTKAGAAAKKLVHHSKTIGACRTLHNTGNITISPKMTVADLEQNFADIFGLTVLILRKSGRAWLKVTVPSGFTLGQQNDKEKINYKMDTLI